MKYVEHGSFMMGAIENIFADDCYPAHSVTLTKDYYIGETEVTQALWYAVTGNSPTAEAFLQSCGHGDNYPVYNISYADCKSFVSKLSTMINQNFRLPTEAEWEYAARGGNKSLGYAWAGSNNIDEVAWYDNNSNGSTHIVKTKAANELGIYDMSGNVGEWCNDWYGYYSSYAQTDPQGPSTGIERVVRGGGHHTWDWPSRIPYRSSFNPNLEGWAFGLRLALTK